ERDREVVLLRDVRGLLDPELSNDVATDIETEDLAGARLGLVQRRCELDPTCLTAPAGEDLRLDDDRAAELLGSRPCLCRCLGGTPLRHREAGAPEELFTLILVEVQAAGETSRTAPRSAGPAEARRSRTRQPRRAAASGRARARGRCARAPGRFRR